MVRPVYGGVAVRATSIEIFDGAKRLRLRRVPAPVMAGVAHAGHPYLQQLRVVRAMGFVAVRAILQYGRMRPEKRPTAFGVATETVLIGRALNELLWIRCAMRVVAAGAGHFALPIRHVRGALYLCPPHLVTLQAQLWLCFPQSGIFG